MTDAALDSVLSLLRATYPGWTNVRDEPFATDEIRYKETASQRARQRLAERELRALLDAQDIAAVASRFLEVGRATNLLYQPAADRGDLGPLHDDTHREVVCRALVDLLYGAGDAPDRVGRFADVLSGQGLARNWPLATYFLFLVYPQTEIFVKPRVTRRFVQAVGSPFRLGTLSGEDYARVRALAHEVRDATGMHGVQSMIDVQSMIWVAGGGSGAERDTDPGEGVLSLETRDRVTTHLEAFALVADDWFEKNSDLGSYHTFFEAFFTPEHLAALEWPDVQAVGRHLHSMQSMAIARGNAFGNPNHEMAHYRRAFEYLARGADPLAVRLDRMRTDADVQIKYLGESTLGEIAGQLFADDYSLYNERSFWALEFLGLPQDTSAGSSFGARIVAFSAAVAPVVALYEETVGARTGWPVRLEVDQFFSWLYATHRGATGGATTVVADEAQSVWLIAPGEGAELWEASYDAGEITIGWEELGDLRDYAGAEEMAERLQSMRPSGSKQTNSALACWEFAHTLRKGDLVFAKKGRRAILGVGTVTSDYRYEPARAGHEHVRSVDWVLKGNWETGGRTLPTKTLTGISKYPDMVAELKALVGMTPVVEPSQARHWWLNFNPTVWSFASAAVGHTEPYTAQNEAGNNRQKYAHFQAVRPGDLIIGYESTPAKRIAGLCTVTRGLHTTDDGVEAFEFEKTLDVPDGPTWTDLQAMPELEDAEPIRSNQGSLFALTPTDYARIVALLETAPDPDPHPPLPPYTVADAEAKAFAEPGAVTSWVDLLRRRKNVILQGPPGVGKTFLAREVAYALMGARDSERLRFVQFHQSYGYEDFVQGYRPSDDGTFALKNGLFYSFVESAKKRPGEPHVFIIDEVNRGNLSKIFGELMMLIERDKRGPEHAIPLAYARSDAARFYVPENVHVLGLMNTADRSLAVVDYALRRRFAFVTLSPSLAGPRFAAFLRGRGASEPLVDRIARRVGALNAQVTADTDLGAGFCVGHSYFCPAGDETPDDAWYERVVRNEVGPLLHEYWFDRPQTAEAAVAGLLA